MYNWPQLRAGLGAKSWMVQFNLAGKLSHNGFNFKMAKCEIGYMTFMASDYGECRMIIDNS